MTPHLFIRFSLLCILSLAGFVPVKSAESPAAAVANDNNPARSEMALVEAARQKIKQDRDTEADAVLDGESQAKQKNARSVVLARRTATVCGWLRNEDDFGRAKKLAGRTIDRLAKLSESSTEDRVERCYWEAWLEGEILDHKQRAVDLLKAGEKLAPDDKRLSEARVRWTAALERFQK